MPPFPGRTPFVGTAMSEQERADVLALATVILDSHCPGAHQIANLCVSSGTQTAVSSAARSSRARDSASRRLVFTRSPGRRGDQRRRSHRAAMSHGEDLSIQTVARGSGLVTEVQRLVAVAELANRLGNVIRRIVKLAEVPTLPLPTSLGDRNCIPRLGGIDPDKYFPTSPHGSSPVR